MTKHKQEFKIGEYVIGGIISVNISDKILTIDFLDYFTKETLLSKQFNTNANNVRYDVAKYLNDNGTSYYTDKVLYWIESNITFEECNQW